MREGEEEGVGSHLCPSACARVTLAGYDESHPPLFASVLLKKLVKPVFIQYTQTQK